LRSGSYTDSLVAIYLMSAGHNSYTTVTTANCLRPALRPFRKGKLRIRIVIHVRTETYGREGVFVLFPQTRAKNVQLPLRRNLHGKRLDFFSLYGKMKQGKDFYVPGCVPVWVAA
jgi:hypothetical protein